MLYEPARYQHRHRQYGRLRRNRPYPHNPPPPMWEITRTSAVHGQSGIWEPKSRVFRGSLSPIRRFGDILPIPLPEAMFKNRGFPTFPLGDLLRSHRNPLNSRTTHGRTDTNHKNPLFLPHRPQIVGLSNSTAFADNESHLCIGGLEGY